MSDTLEIVYGPPPPDRDTLNIDTEEPISLINEK